MQSRDFYLLGCLVLISHPSGFHYFGNKNMLNLRRTARADCCHLDGSSSTRRCIVTAWLRRRGVHWRVKTCRRRLAGYQTLKMIHYYSAIPMTVVAWVVPVQRCNLLVLCKHWKDPQCIECWLFRPGTKNCQSRAPAQ